MKTKLIICALLMTALAVNAQTEKKEATVHIKKVKNVNGVETITDTTFTTTDPSSLKLDDGTNIQTIDVSNGKPDGKIEKMVIVTDDQVITGDDNGTTNVKVIHKGEGMDAEMEKALKEAGVDPNSKGVKKMVIINEDTAPDKDGKTEKKITKIVMIKMNVTDASASDLKLLGKQTGVTDNKLEMDNMSMAPNPSSGKFNLNFNLKNQGDADVTVFNSEGKQVYSEKLPNFTGDYNKSVDIGGNQKGIYFVKIVQGKHSQVKKVF